MHCSLGDTGTYVSSYPLANMIQFHYEHSDQMLLGSNLSSPKRTTDLIERVWIGRFMYASFRVSVWALNDKSDHGRVDTVAVCV